MALIGLCWLGAVLLESEAIKFGFIVLLVMSIIETLAELFVSPIALTLFAQHTTKRYYGIVFGVSSIITALGMRILSTELPFVENIVHIGLIIMIVVSIILYVILASKEERKQNATSTHLEE